MSYLSHLWDHLKAIVADEVKTIKDFLRPLEDGIVAAGEAAVISAVQKAVVAAELHGGTGADKRKAAFEAATAALLASGVKIAAPLVNGAIEAAVVRLNALKLPAAA